MTAEGTHPSAVAADVPGVLGIVVRDAGPRDRHAVARDVGHPQPSEPAVDPIPAQAEGAHAPGLEVSFVDCIVPADLRPVDGDAFAWAPDGVYAMRGGVPGALLQQGATWGAGTITCTRGLRRVPFLGSAVDLAAIAAGWAPLHASAWVTPAGVGVIASGWAHSGKTGALLAALEGGASPIGDDRVLLSGDGELMLGLGRPVEVKDWHIAQLPGMRARVGIGRLALSRVGYVLARGRSWRTGSGAHGLAGRALNKARGLASVEVDLQAAPTEVRPTARPRLLLLMEASDDERIAAEPANPESVATRLAAQTRAELTPALREQVAYRHAHPGAGWRDVECAPERVLEILERAVRGLAAWTVRHPYPCSLDRMHALTTRLAASLA